MINKRNRKNSGSKSFKYIIIFIIIFIFIIYFFSNIFSYLNNNIQTIIFGERIKIKNITTISDIDKDGINDIDDILQGARNEVRNKTNYKSAYYSGGYPPKDEGVCSDVIWRAFKNAGINLKKLIDKDIKNHLNLYTRVNGKPDPNIDFRRVPNLDIFFKRKAISLTTKVIPGNIENLKQWQPGDIVTFDKPKNHIAIISDKRNKYGVPYIIHNSSPTPREDNRLVYWDKNISKIMGHYRWKY